MSKSLFRFLSFAIVGLALAYAGPAAADKDVNCLDPDVGKSCLECHLGGTQVCCPKGERCCVQKSNDLKACSAPTTETAATGHDDDFLDTDSSSLALLAGGPR